MRLVRLRGKATALHLGHILTPDFTTIGYLSPLLELLMNQSNAPEVAIVILNWNGKPFLERFLPSILNSHYSNKRIIVADNASTDDSVSFLREHYKTVEIIQNANNEGFAKGYNTALRQVKSDYYVLLNSDVEVSPDWIGPVIDIMERDQEVAACQPKILAWNDRSKFEYAGASGGWIDRFGYPFMRGRIFDVCEKDNGQYDEPQLCFWASGAAMFVRAKIYNELGGMDEYFFAHQEEIDLCWRMQLAGYKIYVQPASVVYHVGGGTLPTGNSRKTFLNFRNNLIMIHKNFSIIEALWKIPFRILLNAVTAVKVLLQGDGGYFLAIAKAHRGYIKWVLTGPGYKRAAKSKRLNGWYDGSVVWAHFIKKQSRFSEIVSGK